MTARIQSYELVTVAIVVLIGASVLMVGNAAPFAFASPTSEGDAGADKMHIGEADKVLQEGSAKMHIGEAMKALQAGDTAGAQTHAQVAQDSL
ncbi:MAG: hypothetical protein M3297_02050 [Thermoproteota archaeon]|jgi:hypothetical protein|nr:hypothetical protein [Thermoproteota archaeon]